MNDNAVNNWLVKALRDLKTAEQLLSISSNNLYTDTICFASQQSAEKFLKAFLIYNNISFPRTHNLKYLLQLCVECDAEFEALNVDGLTVYAVETRYPETFYIPDIEEAKLAVESAGKIKVFILGKLDQNEEKLLLF